MSPENRVEEFLEKYKLRPERFTSAEMASGKTPDFRVFSGNDLELYCEVKSPDEDTWLDDQLDQAMPEEIVGGLRKDPTFNRLTAHIHKARKQFDAVNPNEAFPNVLAFYNQDENSGFLDLLAVTTGNFFSEDGSVFPIYKNYSEGLVKRDVEKIHLVIWLDKHKPHRFWFNTMNSKFQDSLCSRFGFDPEKLQLVHS
ncbi:hypothetical protein QQF73_00555 [Marinobacter sp. M216]|uniref:Restriction endonuclease n=1 Tax=Marinobacter albus TaxID=3030833 RepID=A0ABT7H6V8_9GAMM|nr:hypothetical protein [Marinobacter sp. M216]MDK9556094.1 hypothetical protein [Marinobacter sp. M216]